MSDSVDEATVSTCTIGSILGDRLWRLAIAIGGGLLGWAMIWSPQGAWVVVLAVLAWVPTCWLRQRRWTLTTTSVVMDRQWSPSVRIPLDDLRSVDLEWPSLSAVKEVRLLAWNDERIHVPIVEDTLELRTHLLHSLRAVDGVRISTEAHELLQARHA